MRLAVLFSGGKDSTFSVYLAQKAGHSIECLISLSSENPHSFLFHTPNIQWTPLLAEAMGISLAVVPTLGRKETELQDLKKALMDLKKTRAIEGVVTGAIASTYQASRIQRVCFELGLPCFNPLWKVRPEIYWKDLLQSSFDVRMSAVAAQGLNETWLGRKLDARAVQELKALHERNGLSIIGEGGEFETLVLNGPPFKKRVHILEEKKEWNGVNGTYKVLRAALRAKRRHA
ncbi:MAG: diphthine--ammonia ligase [Candidatus Diapherotrites archaeon]|nr:diphthine--ammonia ligase [Candidatus Diapherotrites archaeon]